MDNKEPWYLQRRAESLAIVALTRRPDLAVHKRQEDYGHDLDVSLISAVQTSKGTRLITTGEMFGVVIKAFVKSGRSEPVEAERVQLKASMLEQFARFPYPLCLFVFELTSDSGYYTWLREPVVDGSGAKLHDNSSIPLSGARSIAFYSNTRTLAPLDDDALAEIVEQVKAWYASTR